MRLLFLGDIVDAGAISLPLVGRAGVGGIPEGRVLARAPGCDGHGVPPSQQGGRSSFFGTFPKEWGGNF